MSDLAPVIVERMTVGVFILDGELRVAQWNRFMEQNSGKSAYEVVGKSIFESFPDLPRAWLERKVRSVMLLGNFAFSSWVQRPYLFPFRHNRVVTAGIEHMQQDLTFMPLRRDGGPVEAVCVTLFDATDAAIMQRALAASTEELARTQRALVEASRRMGMADVATSVIHNLGNALNGVNVSAGLVLESARRSHAPRLGQLAAMMREQGDLAAFFADGGRGRKIPEYLAGVADSLERERHAMLEELAALQSRLEEANELVAAQHAHVATIDVGERLRVGEILAEVIAATPGSELRCQAGADAEISVDRYKLTSLLADLLEHARLAAGARRVEVRLARSPAGPLRIEVAHDGSPLRPDQVERAFSSDPRLHRCACAALELGGCMAVDTSGALRLELRVDVAPAARPAA